MNYYRRSYLVYIYSTPLYRLRKGALNVGKLAAFLRQMNDASVLLAEGTLWHCLLLHWHSAAEKEANVASKDNKLTLNLPICVFGQVFSLKTSWTHQDRSSKLAYRVINVMLYCHRHTAVSATSPLYLISITWLVHVACMWLPFVKHYLM